MSNEQKIHSPMEAIRQWYRGLTRSQSTLAECGAEGLERMAHDIGVERRALQACEPGTGIGRSFVPTYVSA